MEISLHEFAIMYDRVAGKLIDENQPGGAWFKEDEFEDWAGDALADALEYCLNYFNITINKEN